MLAIAWEKTDGLHFFHRSYKYHLSCIAAPPPPSDFQHPWLQTQTTKFSLLIMMSLPKKIQDFDGEPVYAFLGQSRFVL